MIKKTKDYDMFVFRNDNRDRIDQSHVLKLRNSILTCNMLALKPILVNCEMEIIDGQHRLLAAKSLGVDIFYQVEENLSSREVVLLNISKAWAATDYLNYYVKNNYIQYIRLTEFMKNYDLSLRIALNICMGESAFNYKKFREGEFVFQEDIEPESLELCWDTIEYIKRMNGYCGFMSSSRFWKALVKLVTHHRFKEEKWKENLKRMVERFVPKATTADYCRLFMEVYNWKNNEKVDLIMGQVD